MALGGNVVVQPAIEELDNVTQEIGRDLQPDRRDFALAQPSHRDNMTGAPAAGPDARYCLRVAADTGSLVERIRCWTRRQWVEQGVDVDKAWAREGVSVIE